MSERELIQQLMAALEQRDILIRKLQEQIPQLVARIKKLEVELALYKKSKDSSNSHKPPSSDMNTPSRNKSLREKSGKKPGGQKGHEGSTLEFSEVVDEVIKHTVNNCTECGNDLSTDDGDLLERRQVVDIPELPVKRTEHQSYGKRCSCGCFCSGKFPAHVTSPVQYGGRIEALIAYLHARQFIPYHRTKEFLHDVLGISISSGGINYLLRRFSDKSLPLYDEIRKTIEASEYIGTDETGVKVNGKKHWMWTWQNELLTYITHSHSRGFETILENFPFGLADSFLGHDRWAAHFQCPARGHQICMSHLLRELNFLEDLYQSYWARSLKKLIQRALNLKREMIFYEKNKSRSHIMNQLKDFLDQFISTREQKTIVLQKQLRKHIDSIFLFLFHPKVLPDNNGSERAIRNIKVKQKISGFFRSVQGAKDYAIIRSVIDTQLKRGERVFSSLVKIANLGTE